MAVIHNYIYPSGSEFPQQYCRIETAFVTKTTITYSVGVYLNKDATDNPPHALDQYEADFDLYSELNVWQQAYEALKQRWPDTVDV